MDVIGKELAKKAESVQEANFDALALEIFHYQAANNSLYAQYLQLLGVDHSTINSINEIPFLPIQFFKNYSIQTGNWSPAVIFSSSGTTGQTRSQHLVYDLEFYLHNTKKSFEYFYGDLSGYCFLALLPSYLERSGSSLVAMADYFIKQSRYPQSGFFLNEYDKLVETLKNCKKNAIPTVLLGVSFALLDLAEAYDLDLSGMIIMETGGFKGRKTEIIREELHHFLCNKLKVQSIHSEYGMTELLSQAYAKKEGKFYTPPTLKVFTRQITDPFSTEKTGKTGIIALIDLLNVATQSFILSEDVGRSYADGAFEIQGRLDNSEIRGCNLLLLE